MGNTKNAQVTCSKCEGSGRIEGFYHRDQGRCYACGGAGIRSGCITDRAIVEALVQSTHFMMETLRDGYTDYVEDRAVLVAKSMHKAGHANALAALNRIRLGEFYSDDCDRLQREPEIGRRIAAMIIAEGRKTAV